MAATSTLIVALSTYCVANVLKSLRRTSFLNKASREIIADFAPTLGVATGTLAALWGKSRFVGGGGCDLLPKVCALLLGSFEDTNLFSFRLGRR